VDPVKIYCKVFRYLVDLVFFSGRLGLLPGLVTARPSGTRQEKERRAPPRGGLRRRNTRDPRADTARVGVARPRIRGKFLSVGDEKLLVRPCA